MMDTSVSAAEIYVSPLFTPLLVACLSAALNSDVFFRICAFFAVELCLERKGKQARKKEEVVENHIQQLKERRQQQCGRGRRRKRERWKRESARERKGKGTNLSSTFTSMEPSFYITSICFQLVWSLPDHNVCARARVCVRERFLNP
jgi:hypothetical protein